MTDIFALLGLNNHIFTPVYSNVYISHSNSVARREGVGWSEYLCQLVDRLVPLSFGN